MIKTVKISKYSIMLMTEHCERIVQCTYLYLFVLVDVGHDVHLELWLPHSLSSLFLNALTDLAVTTDSGSCDLPCAASLAVIQPVRRRAQRTSQ